MGFAEQFEAAFEKFEEDALSDIGGKLKPAVEKVTKNIREEIVKEWFGGFNSASLIAATEYHTTGTTKGKTLTATTDSYVNSAAYFPPSETVSKKAWNPGDWQSYILRLQMDQGIIGLPAKSTVTNWVNKHFHQKDPLEPHIAGSGRWEEFEERVKALLGL